MRGRRVSPLFVLAASLALATSHPSGAYAQPKSGAPKPASPAAPAPEKSQAELRYDQHIALGEGFYDAHDYLRAITEFKAAYDAQPSAKPLINQAVSLRELGKLPKAVDALERALAKHGDTMTPEAVAATEREIADLRAKFPYLVVDVTPPTFTLTLDGDPVDGARSGQRIPVSIGPNELDFTSDGFEPRHESVDVASSEEKSLHVALVPTTGHLRFVAKATATPIEIDGRVVGKGVYEGDLARGDHTLRAVGETQAGNVRIEAGKPLTIDLAKTPGALPPLPGAAKAPDEPKRGVYGTLGGAVLVPFKHPVFFDKDSFQDSGASSGGYVGLRGGYRVHTFAAFEGMVEYGNVVGPRNGAGDRSYSLTSIQLGPLLRLMSPGDVFRFVGTIGGGFAIHMIDYKGLGPLEAQVCPESEQCGSSGVDFFAMTEAGVELDLDGVLIGLAGAFYFTGTKGMNDFTKSSTQGVDRSFKEPYANELLPMAGPRAYVGYAFW